MSFRSWELRSYFTYHIDWVHHEQMDWEFLPLRTYAICRIKVHFWIDIQDKHPRYRHSKKVKLSSVYKMGRELLSINSYSSFCWKSVDTLWQVVSPNKKQSLHKLWYHYLRLTTLEFFKIKRNNKHYQQTSQTQLLI